MQCEEITIAAEKPEDIFKKIKDLYKKEKNIHIFISSDIIKILLKEGNKYHIYKHNYFCKYSSTISHILHFSLHQGVSFNNVISSISCTKFSLNYYLLVIFKNNNLTKEYRFDEVNTKKCVFINLLKK